MRLIPNPFPLLLGHIVIKYHGVVIVDLGIVRHAVIASQLVQRILQRVISHNI